MADLLTIIASAVAVIGSLICFILVIVHLFKTEQTGLGIVCIVLVFCGIGGLVAFVKGWMDGLGTVMWVWTACIVVGFVVGLLSNFVF